MASAGRAWHRTTKARHAVFFSRNQMRLGIKLAIVKIPQQASASFSREVKATSRRQHELLFCGCLPQQPCYPAVDRSNIGQRGKDLLWRWPAIGGTKWAQRSEAPTKEPQRCRSLVASGEWIQCLEGGMHRASSAGLRGPKAR